MGMQLIYGFYFRDFVYYIVYPYSRFRTPNLPFAQITKLNDPSVTDIRSKNEHYPDWKRALDTTNIWVNATVH